MDCFGTYFTHVQTCDSVRVHSATQWTALVHTHVQTCDNVRVHSAKQWTASVHTFHMSKPVITFVFTVHTSHMSKPVITFVFTVLRNGLLWYILTHVQTCDSVRVHSATQWIALVHTHVQTCDNVRVHSATQWTALVHTLHMSKPVITFVFTMLRNGLLWYILYTCPNLCQRSCSQCYAMDCFGTYFTHVQTCDNVRVHSAKQWIALVHTLHMSKPVITFVFTGIAAACAQLRKTQASWN